MNKRLALFTIFLILTICSAAFFYAFYNKDISSSNFESSNKLFTQTTTKGKPLFSFLVISDTHLNSEAYSYIKGNLSDLKVDFIVHLGDHSNFGSIEELRLSKKLIDDLKYPYYPLAGDHDIAQTQSLDNFNKVFSTPSLITHKGVKLFMLNNPFNIIPFTNEQMSTSLSNIKIADIVLASQPVYVDKDNFFNYKFMGSLENVDNLSLNNKILLKKYNLQSVEILNQLRNTSKSKIVIAGDHHRSDTFTDPSNSLIKYHIIGALSKSIYLGNKEVPQKSLQSQRFSIISVYENESKYIFEIKEHIIEN